MATVINKIVRQLSSSIRILKYALSLLLVFTTASLWLSSCDKEELKLEFECNGEEIGIIIGIELEPDPEPEEGTRGAVLRTGLDVTNKQALDDCCPKRTWRSWTKPSESYMKGRPPHRIQARAGQWNEDFNPRDGSSNLPSRAPGRNDENAFDSIFEDFPGASNEEIEVEFITCYGCIDAATGLQFDPLACFTWSYEKDGDDVDVDGFGQIDVNDIKARIRTRELPTARFGNQSIPPEPF